MKRNVVLGAVAALLIGILVYLGLPSISGNKSAPGEKTSSAGTTKAGVSASNSSETDQGDGMSARANNVSGRSPATNSAAFPGVARDSQPDEDRSLPPPQHSPETFERDMERYGTRVIPFERTGGVGWTIDFGNTQSKTRGSLRLQLDQSGTVVTRGDAVVLRIESPSGSSIQISAGEVRAFRSEPDKTPPLDTVSFESTRSGKYEARINTSTLQLGHYRVDAVVTGDADSKLPVSFIFEVARGSTINNRGVERTAVDDGHLVIIVGVDSPRVTRIQAIARLSTIERKPIGTVRGVQLLRAGSNDVRIVVPGAFVRDYLKDSEYWIHGVEVHEVRSGADVSRARPWRQSFRLKIPAGVNWNETSPPPPKTDHLMSPADLEKVDMSTWN